MTKQQLKKMPIIDLLKYAASVGVNKNLIQEVYLKNFYSGELIENQYKRNTLITEILDCERIKKQGFAAFNIDITRQNEGQEKINNHSAIGIWGSCGRILF